MSPKYDKTDISIINQWERIYGNQDPESVICKVCGDEFEYAETTDLRGDRVCSGCYAIDLVSKAMSELKHNVAIQIRDTFNVSDEDAMKITDYAIKWQ